MKLNHECIRECLLWLEENKGFGEDIDPRTIVESLMSKKSFKEEDILYSLLKLKEANYIQGGVSIAHTLGRGQNMLNTNSIEEITWEGHEYLDNIRDPKIWKKTKEVTKDFKSVSLSLMGNVAGQVISTMVKNSLGM